MTTFEITWEEKSSFGWTRPPVVTVSSVDRMYVVLHRIKRARNHRHFTNTMSGARVLKDTRNWEIKPLDI